MKLIMIGHPMDRIKFDRTLFFLLKSLNRQESSEGYAMLVTSIMVILVFSLLSIYLFSTKLYSSSSAAIVDGGSTFYAAESGMNQRASSAHAKFEGFSQPVGTPPTGTTVAERMSQCIAGVAGNQGTGDFACSSKDYDYYEQLDSASGIINTTRKSNKNKAKYTAYTFIQPNATNPIARRIPNGEPWAGLNTLTYNYRVYSAAIRQNAGGTIPVSAQTLLNMEFNSNVIPLFQFAAFYENDLEINPSPNMSINGPVHTNSKLFMAPGGDLTLQGNVTSVKDVYNSMSFVSTYAQTTNRILLSNGNIISTAIAWSQANHLVDTIDITNSGGQLRPNINRLNVPQPGFLSKIDPADGKPGEYYAKADLRVEFTPQTQLRDIPFSVSVAKDGGGSTATALAADHLRSLRQPVLAIGNTPAETTALCAQVAVAPANLGLTASEQNQVERAIYAAILAQPEPVAYSVLNQPLVAGSALYITVSSYLNLKTTKTAAILAVAPQAVVKYAGNCFLPAPFQVVSVNDRREGRNIQVLQTNIRSLTAWNKDGKYVKFDPATSQPLSGDAGINGTNSNGLGFDISDGIFTSAAADSGAPAGSYRNFGRAATDRSEGGFVWHFNIDKTAFPYVAKQSIYGFGFTGGQDLPNSLTIATDQAIYLQGDYNTVDRKPAAVMGDTIAVLSNACSNPDRRISCGDLTAGALPVATPTTVNAAFLSRTDATDTTKSPLRYSGGLNNYIRMLEDWQNVPLTYLGSFISLGTPQEFSGNYLPGRVGAPNLTNIASLSDYSYYFPPIRNFSFDTSFNNAVSLPPLTPKVVSLSQKVFRRDYDSNR
jgi:hypothetical protein